MFDAVPHRCQLSFGYGFLLRFIIVVIFKFIKFIDLWLLTKDDLDEDGG